MFPNSSAPWRSYDILLEQDCSYSLPHLFQSSSIFNSVTNPKLLVNKLFFVTTRKSLLTPLYIEPHQSLHGYDILTQWSDWENTTTIRFTLDNPRHEAQKKRIRVYDSCSCLKFMLTFDVWSRRLDRPNLTFWWSLACLILQLGKVHRSSSSTITGYIRIRKLVRKERGSVS